MRTESNMFKRSASRSDKRRVNLIDEILGAAAAIGSDGDGREGLVGYLMFLAKNYRTQGCCLPR